MTLGLTAIDHFINNLDPKARYYVVNKLLPTLARWQLEKISEASEQLVADMLLEQESSFLYDIREVNNNHYAYIKRMGREYPNLYLGVMRFRPGKIYRITHKHKPIQKVVRGLGLEQRGVKTYLKIEFLSPEKAVRSYLFYDPNLPVPRIPQQIDVEGVSENIVEDRQVVTSTLEQNVSSEKYQLPMTPREDWSAIFIKKDWVVEEVTKVDKSALPAKQTQGKEEAHQRKVRDANSYSDITLPLPDKKQIPLSHPPENLYKKKAGQPKQELVSIKVGKNFSNQVESYLEQWATLTQLLPNNPQWQLVVENNLYRLIDQYSNRIIIEYDRTSQQLSARSVRVLHSLLLEAVSNVASSQLVTKENQSLAQKWLLQLQAPSLENTQGLLAFIFDL